MATMYSLFLGLLFTVICSDNGDGSGVLNMFKTSLENGFYSLYQGRDFHFFLDEKTKQKNQGLVAHPKFNLCPLKIKSSPDLSGSNSLIFLTRSPFKFLTVSQPRPFYSVIASTPLQSNLMSPVKIPVFKDDLLAYGFKGRKVTYSSSVHFALEKDFQSKRGTRGRETLETGSVALRSRDEHRLNSLDFFVLFD